MSSKFYRPAGDVTFHGRKVQLFRRTENDTCPISFRARIEGRRKVISTDTPDLALAKARAKQILREIADGSWHQRMFRSRKPRGIPSLGEVTKQFQNGDSVVRRGTARNYVGLLYSIILQTRGIEREKAEKLSADYLDAGLAREYQAMRQSGDRLGPVDYSQPQKCNASINSALRQARSLFGKRQLSEWKERNWEIPESLEGFLRARNLPELSHSYVPIPPSKIEAMNEALPALKAEDERLWIFHLMIRLMGLRKSEILRSRRHWIVERAGRKFLAIRRREGEAAPKRNDGEVPIPAVLFEWFGIHSEDRLIPAANDTEREKLARRHSEWLRQFIPDRTKTNHELRKHAGSLVVEKTGSWERAAEFLRIDLETAKDHYLAFVSPMDPLGLEDL